MRAVNDLRLRKPVRRNRPRARDQATEQDDPENPQRALVGQQRFEQRAQPMRVGVEMRSTGVDLEISDHVHQDERCEHDPGERHDELQGARRRLHLPIPAAVRTGRLPGDLMTGVGGVDRGCHRLTPTIEA